ncbi:MAG: acetylglutamate kinase [Calditrichia bacterium]
MEELVVLKFGGAVLADEAHRREALASVAAIQQLRLLVHGGGSTATDVAEKLGVESNFIDGRRITTSEMRDVALMVYGGLLNKQIVSELQQSGCNALGLSGADGELICGKKREAEINFGYVGDIYSVNVNLISQLLSFQITPVVAPLSFDKTHGLLNTNADTIAATIAASLTKNFRVRLLLCFDKSGVLKDPQDEQSVIAELSQKDFTTLAKSGTISAGMLPKLSNGFAARTAGVVEARIIHWRDVVDALRGEAVGTALEK